MDGNADADEMALPWGNRRSMNAACAGVKLPQHAGAMPTSTACYRLPGQADRSLHPLCCALLDSWHVCPERPACLCVNMGSLGQAHAGATCAVPSLRVCQPKHRQLLPTSQPAPASAKQCQAEPISTCQRQSSAKQRRASTGGQGGREIERMGGGSPGCGGSC